jgi:L-fuconolactonase
VAAPTGVIDSHLHLWDQNLLHYDWLHGAGPLDRSFLPNDLNLGRSGVTEMVFVEADCRPEESLAELRWVSGIRAEAFPLSGIVICGIVAAAPLEHGVGVCDHLDSLTEFDRVVGIRRSLQSESSEFISRPELADGLAATANRSLCFDACVRWVQLGDLRSLLASADGVAERELHVVIDHLGKPPVQAGSDSESADEWFAEMRLLAKRPGTFVKLSGLPAESAPGSDLAVVARPFLQRALDLFGPERCLVGSDWPVSTLVPEELAYDDWFSLVLDNQGLTPAERDQVAHGTATRAYRLPN